MAHLLRRALARLRGAARVPVGAVRFGDFRRTRPISEYFGYDRGRPVDRYYVEGFLARHAADIAGRVLEVGDDTYVRRFGGTRPTRVDVLHVDPAAPGVTIVADLADAPQVPSGAFDCIVLTQTLHLVYDMRAAMATLHRLLAPGGTLLLTVPGISRVDAGEWRDTWYWSLTEASLRRLALERFAEAEIETATHGNVLAACAFLQGLAAEEVSARELDVTDPSFPVIVRLRARRAAAPA